MQMTPDARTWLDETVRRILARYALGDPERAGVTYEIMSHLHAAGEARALQAGHAEVTRQDLELALVDSGGESALADAIVLPLARPIERARFGPRLGAFLIDTFLLLIAVSFVHSAATIAFGHFSHGFGNANSTGLEWLVPWGYHDLRLPAYVQAAISAATTIVILGYYGWFEKHEGRSLGKRALGLRVMRIDGAPMTYRESILRNLVKLNPFLLFLDTLVMLVFLHKDRQRVSDKIVDTIVVQV
ncbi:MAG: RDD family protein [Euryarchaeota archaeon]|nr:RDD family protein [Euryarchaeota archaeon]